MGDIPEVVRTQQHVHQAMDLAVLPTLWNQAAPNPVAAIPSLHAGWATLLIALVTAMFGWRWFLAVLPYPSVIFAGTVYSGEHYVVDVVLGVGYAITTILAIRLIWRRTALIRQSSRVADIR